MFFALLAKDLRRAWRNPIPWLLNLALPLCITGIIGLVFGGQGDKGLGRVRFAVVDEDNSALTGMLRGALNQGEGGKYLEPVFLDRAAAEKQIRDSGLSAALIIPTNFTRDYLSGQPGVKLELIKNPAQSIHPTVLEELAEALVTALNAVSRNFQSEFPAWRAAFQDGFDSHRISGLVEHTGLKLEAAKQYLNPPLVVYETVERDETKPEGVETNGLLTSAATNGVVTNSLLMSAPTDARSPAAGSPRAQKEKKAEPAKQSQTSGIFAFLLLGLSAMFLFFLAGNAVIDLLREVRFRTFERYQTLRQGLLPFVLIKLVFAVVLLLFSCAVMLGGGGLIFRIHWQQPWSLIALLVGYACFATTLMAVFVGLMPDERRANALTSGVGMLMAIAGGCMFPRHQLPKFLGEHITPMLPTAWFVEAARDLQFGGTVAVTAVLLKFGAVALVLLGICVLVLRRRFQKGLRV
jgi:ABC-type Na+ efflux pump permease subunit